MSHRKIALVLATGSVSLVEAAQRSGNPAIGVGPGNVPVYLGESADISVAVKQIIVSKTFDNGTVCASEQAMVVLKHHEDKIIRELKKNRAYFLSEEETRRLEAVAFNKAQRVMNVEVIGQRAVKIAQMAGIDVPANTTVLIARPETVGIESPVSLEILAPILAFYSADSRERAFTLCQKINRHGGLGHTVSIFSENEEEIEQFAILMDAGRVLVNTPASQGALGGIYNALRPSMMLACGPGGKNITSDNITTDHLISIQRIAKRNESV